MSAFDTTYASSGFDLQSGPRDHFNATFDLALNRTMAPRAGYNFYSTEILNTLSLALSLDFEATLPLETKHLDFVVAKCAEFVSLSESFPLLTMGTEINLSLLANGTHRN